MKRIIYLLALIVLVLSIIFVYKLTIKEFKTTYKINKHKIDEEFYLNNKRNIYNIKIDNKYTYTIIKNFKKNKRIIKDIKTYKKNNISCIIPIYKKNNNKEIYCLKDKIQVSNYYLLEENNKDYLEILSKAKIKKTEKKEIESNYKQITIYNNLDNNRKYIIWNYKGIYVIDNSSRKNIKILEYDIYDNLMTIVNSRYFVLFENTKVTGIENIYYYDLKKNKLKKIKLENKIDKDSYINGIHNDLIYVTDNKNKKQYTVNISKGEIKEIGNEENKYIVYKNNKKELLNISDFFIKKQIFTNTFSRTIKSNDIKKEYDYFYYLENNEVYRQLEDGNKELLFELENIDEWNVYDRDILLISDGVVYLYNDEVGLVKILSSNELKYNYKDIVKMWKN